MTDKAISPLRRRMIADMTIRKLAPKTQASYIRAVRNFTLFLAAQAANHRQGSCTREPKRRSMPSSPTLASGTAAAVVGSDSLYFAHRQHIAAAAAARRVPTIYYARQFATAGGLMSYGADIPDVARRAGIYTAQVLKGSRPMDMSVQWPTKFQLVINLRTANALGLKVPPLLLARADEAIE